MSNLTPITKSFLQEFMEPEIWRHYWFKMGIVINDKQSKVEGWLAGIAKVESR